MDFSVPHFSNSFQKIGLGVAYGVVDAFFSLSIQKICMIAGVIVIAKSEEIIVELFDCEWKNKRCEQLMMTCGPIFEELFFRGVLQPLCSKTVLYFI